MIAVDAGNDRHGHGPQALVDDDCAKKPALLLTSIFTVGDLIRRGGFVLSGEFGDCLFRREQAPRRQVGKVQIGT